MFISAENVYCLFDDDLVICSDVAPKKQWAGARNVFDMHENEFHFPSNRIRLISNFFKFYSWQRSMHERPTLNKSNQILLSFIANVICMARLTN